MSWEKCENESSKLMPNAFYFGPRLMLVVVNRIIQMHVENKLMLIVSIMLKQMFESFCG